MGSFLVWTDHELVEGSCYEECLSKQQWIKKNNWSASIVKAVQQNSLALWWFRCALLHGRIKAESYLNKLTQLQELTTVAYEEFEASPFILK
jgi:hypothetical protein